jgi:hypothetical protein
LDKNKKVGMDSEWSFRVERHVCTRTVVSVNKTNTNPTKRVGLIQSGHHYHVNEN